MGTAPHISLAFALTVVGAPAEAMTMGECREKLAAGELAGTVTRDNWWQKREEFCGIAVPPQFYEFCGKRYAADTTYRIVMSKLPASDRKTVAQWLPSLEEGAKIVARCSAGGVETIVAADPDGDVWGVLFDAGSK